MSRTHETSISHLIAGVAVVLAAGLAMISVSNLREPVAAAEGQFLAFVACTVLLAFWPTALANGRASQGLWSAQVVLVTLAVCSLQSGPVRGGTVTLLLAASVLLPLLGGRFAVDLAHWLPLSVGLQLLLRESTLVPLQIGWRQAITLLVLPMAGTLLASLLARRRGDSVAALTLLAVVLCGGGFTVTGVLTLFALVVMHELVLVRERVGFRAVALLALALLLLWDPTTGLVLALGGVSLIARRWWLGVLLVGAGALGLVGESRPWSLVLTDVFMIPVLLPVWVARLFFRAPRLRWEGFAAVALAVVALRSLDPAEALVMPVALLALTFSSQPGDLEGKRASALAHWSTRVSGYWLSFLLFATVLMAGYPWLRWPRIADTLDRFGARGAGLHSLILALLVLVFFGLTLSRRAAGAEGRNRHGILTPSAVGLLVTSLLAFITVAAPFLGATAIIGWPPVVLDSQHQSWSMELKPSNGEVGFSLVIDSALRYSTDVPAGATAFEVRLSSPGSRAQGWQLRVGVDTGEWAAARVGSAAPPAWSSWIDPSSRFLAQRYRCRLDLGKLSPGTKLEIARADGLPESVAVNLYRVVLVRQGTLSSILDRTTEPPQ